MLVLERNDRPGGCIRTDEITAPGFIHDVLSSWHPLFVTSPGYAELKEDLEKYGLEYCNSDSPTAVVLPDHSAFILKNSRDENISNMNALADGDGDRYGAAMAELEKSLGLTFTLLGSELWRWSTLKVFLSALVNMGPFRLAQYFGGGLQPARAWLDTTFSSNAVRACLAGWPSHAGIGPDAPSSALMAQVIAFTLEMAGCPVVKGGNYNIVRAFQQVIEANGGELQVNADVVRVITENGRATGVKTRDGNEYRGNKVICSVTPNQLYEQLLDPADVPAAVAAQTRAYRYGNGDMQIHLALSEPPRNGGRPEWKMWRSPTSPPGPTRCRVPLTRQTAACCPGRRPSSSASLRRWTRAGSLPARGCYGYSCRNARAGSKATQPVKSTYLETAPGRRIYAKPMQIGSWTGWHTIFPT